MLDHSTQSIFIKQADKINLKNLYYSIQECVERFNTDTCMVAPLTYVYIQLKIQEAFTKSKKAFVTMAFKIDLINLIPENQPL